MSAGFGGPTHLGDLLSALLDGELPPGDEAGAHAHLAVCPDCAGELVSVGQARMWIRTLPPVDPPSGLFERISLDWSQPVSLAAVSRPVSLAAASRPVSPAGSTFRRRLGVAALGAAAVTATVFGIDSPGREPLNPGNRVVEASSTNVSAAVDLLSKLAPLAVPVSFGR